MLWWHLGDWHELLGRRASAGAAETRMLASGIELGDLVLQPPGPHGAYGILRKISGPNSARETTLRATLRTLSEGDAKKLSNRAPPSAKSLFPVHAAVQSVVEHGSTGWDSPFDKAVPNILDVELTFFDLGIQAYRERVLINKGGLSE